NLQVGSAEPIQLIGFMRGTQPMEKSLHRRFRHLRVRGEWFHATSELMRYIERVTPLQAGEDQMLSAAATAPPEAVDGPENWETDGYENRSETSAPESPPEGRSESRHTTSS
ncbi:MAG TPA: GIY-YIG nuclease family protein, partial [Xanthobacteraceae bacterium]|nr:GIY-YIG nuclease family protein [Xanthobacteraceae bacterium]